MQSAWPVRISSSGGATAGTVAWRRGARLFVTVMVKGTFALALNDLMVPVTPEAIFVREQEGPPGFALRAADDLAPYLEQTDVTLIGYAITAASPGLRSIPARLGVLRDQTVLLDKRVAVEVPQPYAASLQAPQYRVPIVQMGPLSRDWPVRSRLLGSANPRHLQGTFLEIPDPFDWRYFQAAPPDQRVAHLRGGEWLVLDGMHPTHPRFMSRLPALCGVARVLGRQPHPAAWQMLELVLDTVCIDADRRRCSLTWRGYFPLVGEHELGSLTVVAGLEPKVAQASTTPQSPASAHASFVALPPASPAAASPPSSPQPPGAKALLAQSPAEDPLAGTLILGDDDVEVEAGDPLLGTVGLTEETAAEIAARPATPFLAVGSPRGVDPGLVPVADPLLVTVGLRDETAAELAARPSLPFRAGSGSVSIVENDPLAGTLGPREHAASGLAARPATPFRGDIGAAMCPPTLDPLGSTLGLTEEAAAQIAARPVVPFLAYGASTPAALSFLRSDDALGTSVFDAPRPEPLPPPMDLRPDEGDMPYALGAQFLLAMASIEKQRGAAST